MKMSQVFGGALVILSLLSCQNRTCTELPDFFKSDSDAIQQIRNARFKSKDSIKISAGDWYTIAFFYSCNKSTGYLILRDDSGYETYNPKVPSSIWDEFKASANKNTFYEDKIRRKFLKQTEHEIRN